MSELIETPRCKVDVLTAQSYIGYISKLVEVVTVAHVDAEDHVGNSLLQIWELTFSPKGKLLCRL